MLYLAYLSHSYILDEENSEESEMSVVQIQANYQTKESIW